MRDVCSTLEQDHKASLEQLREELISQYDDELEEMQKELSAHSGRSRSLLGKKKVNSSPRQYALGKP